MAEGWARDESGVIRLTAHLPNIFCACNAEKALKLNRQTTLFCSEAFPVPSHVRDGVRPPISTPRLQNNVLASSSVLLILVLVG